MPGFGEAPEQGLGASPSKGEASSENSLRERLLKILQENSVFTSSVRWQQVRIVAKGGGNYSTIADALTATTDAATDKRYLVLLMPGEYNETVTMKDYVDVVGNSKHSVRITGAGGVVGADNCLLQNITLTAGPLANVNGNNGFTATDVDVLKKGSILTSGRYERVFIEDGAGSGDTILTIAGNSRDNRPTFSHCTISLDGAGIGSEYTVELTASNSWAEFEHCTIKGNTGIRPLQALLKADAISAKEQLVFRHTSFHSEMNHNDALNNDFGFLLDAAGEFYNCSFVGSKVSQAIAPKIFADIPAAGVIFVNCSFKGGTQLVTTSGDALFEGCVQAGLNFNLGASATFRNCYGVTINSFNAPGTEGLTIVGSSVFGAFTYTAGTWTVTLLGNIYFVDINLLTQNANISYTGTDLQTHLFPASELTIAAGAITVLRNFHTVDTESDASSDDLDTISGGTSGEKITLQAENGARTVVVKHGTGNIRLMAGVDVSLDNTEKVVELLYDGTNWMDFGTNTLSIVSEFIMCYENEVVCNDNNVVYK